MLPIDVSTDLTVTKITAMALSKTGRVVYKYRQDDEEQVIHLPAEFIRPIVNTYKTFKFTRGLPLAIMSIKGMPVLVVHKRLPVLVKDTEEFHDTNEWTTVLDRLVSLVQTEAARDAASQWYCDGACLYRQETNTSLKQITDNLHVVKVRGIRFSAALKTVITSNFLEISSYYALVYTNGKIVTPPVTVRGSAIILATEYKDIDNTMLARLHMYSPTVGNLLRSVTAWSEIHGNALLAKLPVASLLLHYRVTNLYDIPALVRDAAPCGMDLVNMIVWNMALCYRAQTIQEMAVMQKTLQSLVGGGYADISKMGPGSLYCSQDDIGKIPPVFKV